MRFTGEPVQRIGQTGVEIDLYQNRNRQHGDDRRLFHDLLALKAKQQYERGQQGDEREWREFRERRIQGGVVAGG